MTRSRKITWSENGGTTTLVLPDLEMHGIKVGAEIAESRVPGTHRWQWGVTGMPIGLVTGMSAGFARTRWGARRALRQALRFWESYGYTIDWDGAR